MRTLATGVLSLLLTLLPAGGSVCAAPGIAVIVHDRALAGPLDRAALALIYRRWQRIDDDGQPLVPVNLPASDPVRRAFTQSLFRQTPEAMRSFWNERYFQGVSPPTVQESREAVRRFVQRTPGAIGYLPDCEPVEGVVVAMHLDWPPGQEPGPATLCEGDDGDISSPAATGPAGEEPGQ